MQKWELFRKFPFLPLKLSTLCRQLQHTGNGVLILMWSHSPAGKNQSQEHRVQLLWTRFPSPHLPQEPQAPQLPQLPPQEDLPAFLSRIMPRISSVTISARTATSTMLMRFAESQVNTGSLP
jgi:hypothetical protein